MIYNEARGVPGVVDGRPHHSVQDLLLLLPVQ